MSVAPLSADVTGFTVVFDSDNSFSTWCRGWLEGQALAVPLRFTPAGGSEARSRLGVLGTGADLVVLADDGRAWTGAAALVMCLWATARHRDLSRALRLPVEWMAAESFFHAVTADRVILDRLVGVESSGLGCPS